MERVELVGRLAVLRDELARFCGQRTNVDRGRVMAIVQQIDTTVCALAGVGLESSM